MLETTHVLTALALAKNVQNPFLAFGLGLVSHLVLDAIPHYDFQGKILKPEFYEKERKTLGKAELSKTGKIVIYSDVFVSLSIFIFLSIWGPLWPGFPNFSSFFSYLISHLYLVFGVLGGIFPDLLNLIRWKTGFCWPEWFFKLHREIQPPKTNAAIGLISQTLLIAFSLYYFVK